jgi:hypothetical protein
VKLTYSGGQDASDQEKASESDHALMSKVSRKVVPASHHDSGLSLRPPLIRRHKTESAEGHELTSFIRAGTI